VCAFGAPRGQGPYGITTTPRGAVYYASLAGSYVGRIDTRTGRAAVLNPPTRGQGARRVWSDSRGRIWISEWNAGKLGMFDPSRRRWREWRLLGSNPQPYAVYVDNRDIVWVSDFGANAIVRFDPRTQGFTTIRLPSSPAMCVSSLGGRTSSGAPSPVSTSWSSCGGARATDSVCGVPAVRARERPNGHLFALSSGWPQ
jgi:virginiamycin B lyase